MFNSSPPLKMSQLRVIYPLAQNIVVKLKKSGDGVSFKLIGPIVAYVVGHGMKSGKPKKKLVKELALRSDSPETSSSWMASIRHSIVVGPAEPDAHEWSIPTLTVEDSRFKKLISEIEASGVPVSACDLPDTNAGASFFVHF